jgi:hypothetical protein
MPPFMQAGHERRMAAARELPIGDVSQKVLRRLRRRIVGLRLHLPALQHCRHAIGIDISAAAVEESARLSATGELPVRKELHVSHVARR